LINRIQIAAQFVQFSKLVVYETATVIKNRDGYLGIVTSYLLNNYFKYLNEK